MRRISEILQSSCKNLREIKFNDLSANYERVADHCSNLAICIIELAQGEDNVHEYTGRAESERDFAETYRRGRQKYALP